jgi:hypothetical protein
MKIVSESPRCSPPSPLMVPFHCSSRPCVRLGCMPRKANTSLTVLNSSLEARVGGSSGLTLAAEWAGGWPLLGTERLENVKELLDMLSSHNMC